MAGDAGPGAGEIEYRVYANDGAGGPIDLSMPWKTTRSADRVEAPALVAGDRWKFLVRVADLGLGLEDESADAIVELAVDGDGEDVSGRPRPVSAPTARSAGPGAIEVAWSDLAPRDNRAATGYRVWAQTPGPIDFDLDPAATLEADHRPGRRVVLAGLAPGASYEVAVRAFNGTADDGSTASASTAAGASSPDTDAPASLAAGTSWGS